VGQLIGTLNPVDRKGSPLNQSSLSQTNMEGMTFPRTNESLLVPPTLSGGDQMFSVDRLMLFGILYSESLVDSSEGNQVKALLFFHLLHNDNIV